MNSTDWLPVQSVLVPPSVAIAVSIDLALSYLTSNGVDSSAIIVGVKEAVSAVANASNETLSVDAIVAAALAVPGVRGVRSATIDGDAVDVSAANFTTRLEFVDLADTRIVVS